MSIGQRHKAILLNMVPVKTGGGLQNALSFLNQLAELESVANRVIVVCEAGSEIHRFCEDKSFEFKTVKASIWGRLKYEAFGALGISRRKQVSLIFSIFGAPPLCCFNYYSVSGFAYSNIIQKEVPFWDFYPLKTRVEKRIKDLFRVFAFLFVNEIILETDYLAERAARGVFKRKVLHVVKMEPSTAILPGSNGDFALSKTSNERVKKILYLAGAHPNKRIHLLANVVRLLNESGSPASTRYKLVVTLPENNSYTCYVIQCFRSLGMEDQLENIGPVPPSSIASCLEQCDAIVNVALLESFSNNWVEAWSFKKPLIVTDADWARASCSDAAIYVDPSDAASAASLIRSYMENEDACNVLIEAGEKQLVSLKANGRKIDRYRDIMLEALQESGRRKSL